MMSYREAWSKSLVEYTDQIKNGKFNEKEFYDFYKGFYAFGGPLPSNGLLLRAEDELVYSEIDEKLKKLISEHFDYPTDEICFEEYDAELYKFDNKIKIYLLDVNFYNSPERDLSNLENILGSADFRNSQITSLRNLINIGRNAYFVDSKVSDLSNLRSIGGHANFLGSKVTNLTNLKSIGGSVVFANSNVTDLRSLVSIGQTACFAGSKEINLSNLQTIGDKGDFYASEVSNLGSLQNVGGDLDLRESKVNNLSSLKEVKGKVFMDDWQAELFGDMFVKEGDHYKFVPENERASRFEATEK